MRLTDRQWQQCLETVKGMVAENLEKHERTLFIISAAGSHRWDIFIKIITEIGGLKP